MFRRLLVVPIVAFLALLTAPVSHADTYYEAISHQLSPDTHVVVDNNAIPMLPNPARLNDQIKFNGVPMWIINIAANLNVEGAMEDANKATDPFKDALYASHNPITNDIQVNGQPHKPPLIILVIDKNGYHAWAYDVSKDVANAVGPKIREAAAHHPKDLEGTVSEYISTMGGIPDRNTPGDASGPVSEPTDWSGFWTFCKWVFWIIMAGIGGFLVFLFGRSRVEARERRQLFENGINSDIVVRRSEVNDLADEVLAGMDVSQEQTNATLALSDAEKARDEGNYDMAANHLLTVKRYIDKAEAKLGKRSVPADKETVKAFTKEGRKPKKAVISARDKAGEPVKITNSDYKTRSQKGYRHWYQGGTRDGVDFYPGWYPVFIPDYSWDSGQVTESGTLKDYSGTYDGGDSSSLSGALRDYGGSSSFSGASSHKSSSGHSSGGGSSSHGHSHSSSSYSGGSSSGGSSGFSGGFDSGGGGFSGGDSGGGSAGF